MPDQAYEPPGNVTVVSLCGRCLGPVPCGCYSRTWEDFTREEAIAAAQRWQARALIAEERVATATRCLEPVYRLAEEKRRRRRPSLGTMVLAERVRRALTETEPGA